MKKSWKYTAIVLLVLLATIGATAGIIQSQSSNGKYDTDGDGLIETSSLEQLNAVRYDLDGDGHSTRREYSAAFPTTGSESVCNGGCNGYELTRSLDFEDPGSYAANAVNPRWVTGAGWLPIGINEHQPFVATFNGNSHVIANLYIHRTTAHGSPWSSGLFSVIGSSSIIREVSILNAQIAAVGSIGPLVGWNLRGIIRDCQASGRVRVTTADHQGNFNVGGLVGDNYDQGTIINSRAETAVIGVGAEATDSMGGLVGNNWGSISNSYATGQVSGAFTAGGLVGDNSGSISNSYATGQVSATSRGGGLAGYSRGSISNSYATGQVSGSSGGGLAGGNSGTISNSYATGDVILTDDDSWGAGLTAGNYGGTIRASYATGNVTAGYAAGGLTTNNSGTIIESYYSGAVQATGRFAGGLAVQNFGNIIASYATGTVQGGVHAGGISGTNDGGSIIASYAAGTVQGDINTGGISGTNSGSITWSYWDTQTSAVTTGVGGGDPSGAGGRTTAELQGPTGYTGIYSNWNTDLDNEDGDFDPTTGADDFWHFGTSRQYPALRWQVEGHIPSTPTPEPTSAPPETPTPTSPAAQACRQLLGSLTAPRDFAGEWTEGCQSETQGRGYARFYTFSLTEEIQVTITLESDEADTYLYLREGETTSGEHLQENDDHQGSTSRSLVQETLAAGTYTIEATTYGTGETGSFTLSVTGLGRAGAPGPGTDCYRGPLPGDGRYIDRWEVGCESETPAPGAGSGARLAHHYTFALAQESEVTITLESTEADTYLYLREGQARSGDFLHENDDDDGTTRSRIQESLAAGTYTIEATTYAGGETGSFTLILSGLGAASGPTPSVPALWFDAESQPFDDPRVRYAISYAIDQELINEIFWDGRGDLQSPVPDALFPQWTTELDDPGVLQEWHLYDPEESRRLLAEAGYPDGLETRGVHVLPRWVEWAEVIVVMLAEVGIVVDVVISDPARIAELGQVSHQSMILAPFQRFGGDVAAFIREHFTDQGQHNYSRVASDVPEEILSEFVDTEDPEKRRELVYNLQNYLHDWWFLVPLPAPPTPPAPTDPCIEPLAGLVTIIWDWDEDACASEVPGRGYARYFSFTVAQASEVTITLESEVDTYLYLREGQDRSGEPLHENDDLESGDTNSRITTPLAAGTYTVEATTYDPRQTGDFTLSFEGLGTIEPPPPPVFHPCVEGLGTLTGEVRRSGQWAGDCPSNNRNGSDARFYEFTLAQGGEVQIDLASETDTYLYLMRDFGKDGPVEAENDDVEPGNTNSRITATLAAGTYTIEATTYSVGETGSFTLTLSGLGTATTTPPTSNDNDRDVLVALYNATGGANWTNNYNWLTNAPLGQWHGVTTDTNGRVTRLYLSSNQLSGGIPPQLGSLANLESLSLNINQLSGEIPAELGSLSNLRQLHLSGNQLSGEIPPWLSNLANLEYLSLNINQLSGEIPPWLGNLTFLGLLLGGNQLSGEIPAELGNLANLEYLGLEGNQLSGEIPPWLGNLANLEWLSLEGNQLSGEIPWELGGLSNLQSLRLYSNQLSGEMPAELGSLANLEWLSLGDNQLNGEIPAELGNLANLYWLVLSGNQLSGEIPPQLGNLANLEYLSLYSNQLSGEIPSQLGNLASLESLHLFSNQLTGEIPAELGNLANLYWRLDLSGNQLSGEIPPQLGNLANLYWRLDLSGNQLSGEIPAELGSLSNLRQLYLDGNQLSSEIPSQLGNLASLEVLYLFSNQLTGEIPAELGSLSNLRQLYLSGNQLTGCVPAGLRDVPNNDFAVLGLPFCVS